MDPILAAALAPVLRDLRSSGIPAPRFEDDDWSDHPDQVAAMLCGPGANAVGVSVLVSETVVARAVDAADQVQEWTIEQLWGHAPTNWPPCPHHPTTHPLRAAVRDDVAVWTCPVNEALVAPVGQL